MNELSLVSEAVQPAAITAQTLGAEAGRCLGARQFDGNTPRAAHEHHRELIPHAVAVKAVDVCFDGGVEAFIAADA